MEFFDVVHKRRSIRKFSSQPVEKDKLDQILEAAMRAPSAKSGRPWQFVVVDQPQLLTQLSAARPAGSAFIKGAATAVVVCADPKKSGPWIEDAAIAAVFMQLSAEALGMASCWSQMRTREHDDQTTAGAYVAGLLGLPEGLEVQCIVALGYPAESKPAYDRAELPWDCVSYNRFGQKKA
jgi:nitroreductase